MDENTIDGLNKKISNEILVAAEESIPVITNAKKSFNLPPCILSMIKKRRELRARTRETNQATAKTECNKIKKEINAAIGKKSTRIGTSL